MLLNNRVLRWSLDERSTGASRAVLCASSEVYELVAAAFKTTFTSGPAGTASLDGISNFFFFFRSNTRLDDRLQVTMMSAEIVSGLYLSVLASKSVAFC